MKINNEDEFAMYINWDMEDSIRKSANEKLNELNEHPAFSQIDELRKISNIIQALENLQAQCNGYEPFNHITEFAKQSLLYSHQQLRRVIHK